MFKYNLTVIEGYGTEFCGDCKHVDTWDNVCDVFGADLVYVDHYLRCFHCLLEEAHSDNK